jgi:hypothetical protein
MTHRIATAAMNFAEAPEFGHGEVNDRPIAVPNVRNTNERAAAKTAPAKTALHSTKLAPAGALTDADAVGDGPTWVMDRNSLERGLAKAQKTQDKHDDHDETDQIDDAFHGERPRFLMQDCAGSD